MYSLAESYLTDGIGSSVSSLQTREIPHWGLAAYFVSFFYKKLFSWVHVDIVKYCFSISQCDLPAWT